MAVFKTATRILLLATLSNAVYAKPVESATGSQDSSVANANGLDLPPEFKVVVVPETKIPVPQGSVQETAFEMMWEVTGSKLTSRWRSQNWHLRNQVAIIELAFTPFGLKGESELTTQYVIWGLTHLMLSMGLSARYCQTTATLYWKGDNVGTIRVARDESAFPAVVGIASTDGGHRVTATVPTVHLDFRYRGAVIGKELVYYTAIKAMGEAAGQGLGTSVNVCVTKGLQQVSWTLINYVAPSFKMGLCRLAIRQAVSQMNADGDFHELSIWVKVNGLNTAVGGFKVGNGLVDGTKL
ncbi:MAG: hypothetical protein Q9219_004902 [cf. Caloplaca sp. 3 TL-2023]